MAQVENGGLHNRITDVYQRLCKLDSRLSRVTSNICGNVPEGQGETAKSINEHLHEKLDSINRVVSSMEEEMVRLENAVGSNQAIPKGPSQAVGY